MYLGEGVRVHRVNMFAVVTSHHIIKSCKTKIKKIRNSQHVEIQGCNIWIGMRHENVLTTHQYCTCLQHSHDP